MSARLKDIYKSEIVPAMIKKFEYKNRLDKKDLVSVVPT